MMIPDIINGFFSFVISAEVQLEMLIINLNALEPNQRRKVDEGEIVTS